jgi:hypothetical protein
MHMLSPFPEHLFYTLLILGEVATIVLISWVLPLQWGWKAFPIVPLGMILFLALFIFAFIVLYEDTAGGSVFHLNEAYLVSILLVAAAVFWAVRAYRRRSTN